METRKKPTIDEQDEILMSGTGYGDDKTREEMAKALKGIALANLPTATDPHEAWLQD